MSVLSQAIARAIAESPLAAEVAQLRQQVASLPGSGGGLTTADRAALDQACALVAELNAAAGAPGTPAPSGPAPAPAPTPAPAPAPAAAEWSTVGHEDQTVTLPPGTLARYGSGSAWVEKVVGGTFVASNAYFGRDPISNVKKQVQTRGVAQVTAPGGAAPAPAPSADGPLARIGERTFNTLVEASDACAEGDVIEILRAGRMQEATAAFHKQQRNEIRGVGNKPELRVDGSFRPAWGKGVIVHEGGDLTVRNLSITGAHVPEDNGAGIRTGDNIRSLLVEDCDLYENENGLLLNGGARDATVTLRRVNLRGNGLADSDPDRYGRSHNIYCNAIARLTIEDSTSTDCVHGHSIKTRALETILTNVQTRGSREARELDVSNGGKVYAKGCRFEKLPGAAQRCLIGIGNEGVPDGRPQEYVFEDCEFVNGRDNPQLLDNATGVPVRFIRCKGVRTSGSIDGAHEIID